ncbi:putative periplasmic protein YibQ [Thermosulfurimonas dismutans]|uniref:Putative periplasmic protein YibQ n=1 Tax=Thermosulfurimonas dismutans TaxID=999894 RepID=A0A179D4Y1_9BACT|nr:divergent polysaccharide deacetylase family protein [Thermosulfurimonas dismutans]OAQ21154.1 putative periplasmic protein YibQ [Thermosulfurimonas dismutans]
MASSQIKPSKSHRAPKNFKRPRVALIIDDMGQRPILERKFFKLGLTLNFSFLPYAPFTEKLAREAHQKGFTVMIHIPMEAENEKNSGPGTLKLFMTEKEIKDKVREMISRVPFASGANQHMGSLFSQDPLKMKWVLEVLRENHLFFIDSRTTPYTIAPFVAQSLKIPFAERGHFLDNNLQEVALEKSFENMLAKARKQGRLIVIAHPHPQTLKLLKHHRKDLIDQVTLVPVQKLVEVRP